MTKSPFPPRALTTSGSQVCAAVGFCAGAEKAGQYRSMWFLRPYALCLHIHKYFFYVLRQYSFLSKVLCLLVILIYLCWSSSYYCTRLWHLEQNFCHCSFWNILAPFIDFKTVLFFLLGPWPKSKFDNYKECSTLEVWTGASIFASLFVSQRAKQRQISINWN